MDNVQAETTTHEDPKSARITLSSAKAQLTLFAVRKADNSAATFAVTTDLATKKTSRGMTEKHATFDAAKIALAKHAAQAEKLGWTRKQGGRRFTARPDAFSALPPVPKQGK